MSRKAPKKMAHWDRSCLGVPIPYFLGMANGSQSMKNVTVSGWQLRKGREVCHKLPEKVTPQAVIYNSVTFS